MWGRSERSVELTQRGAGDGEGDREGQSSITTALTREGQGGGGDDGSAGSSAGLTLPVRRTVLAWCGLLGSPLVGILTMLLWRESPGRMLGVVIWTAGW